MVPAAPPGPETRLNRKLPSFWPQPKLPPICKRSISSNSVLADVANDDGAAAAKVGAVDSKAVGVAETEGVDLSHLARTLKRVAAGQAVLAVGADGVGAARGEHRVDGVDTQHLAQRRAQVLRVAAGLKVAQADIVGVAAVAQAQVHETVGAEGDGAAVVVACVLAERDDLAARPRIDQRRIARADVPFRDHVLVVLQRAVGGRVGGRCAGGYQLAGVGVQRAEAHAARCVVAGVECQAEKTTLIVGVSGVERRRHQALHVQRG